MLTSAARRTPSRRIKWPVKPDLLRRFFDAVFAACPLPVSVKTRLGKATAETFPALLELYNDYPICELIVHPRVQADQYHGHPDLDMFAYALAHSRAPVCYNGDLFDARPRVSGAVLTVERVPFRPRLVANPGLTASCAPAPCRRRHSFRRFTTGFTPPRARASPTGARCCFA
ncbi:MAG: tRNA-dihydrouridine synthase [Oscillospiraceae bacterium]